MNAEDAIVALQAQVSELEARVATLEGRIAEPSTDEPEGETQ